MADENTNVENIDQANNQLGQVPVANNDIITPEVPIESLDMGNDIITPEVPPVVTTTNNDFVGAPAELTSPETNPLSDNPLLSTPFPEGAKAVDPDASVSSDEPVIQKVIDVDKQRKIRLIIIIAVLVVIIGVVVAVFVLPSGKKSKNSTINARKVSNNYSMFVNSIDSSAKSGALDKEVNKALKEVRLNTDTLSMMALDIDSDNELELVAFAEDGSEKYLLQFEVYDGDVLYEDKFQLNEKNSLAYAYSIKEGKTYWITDYVSEYTIIKHPRRVLKSIDFLDGYYVITNKFDEKEILDNAVEYKSGYKLNALKLEESAIDYEKILVDNSLTKENVKDMALKYKSDRDEALKNALTEQQNREVETNENALTLNLNGFVLHYGKYVENANIFYGDLVLHQNGVCELGSIKCTWTYGNFDFGTGSLEQSIDITRGSELIHFTARSNDAVTNCDSWSAIHQ